MLKQQAAVPTSRCASESAEWPILPVRNIKFRETAELFSKRISLIDGDQLARFIRHNVGCRIEETFHMRKVDEEFSE